MTLDTIAERYVKFVLAIGLHHEYYVDAYFGPKEWKIQDKQSLEVLLETAKVLYKDLQKIETTEKLRKEFLLIHIQSCETFIEQLNGKKISFDEESFLLYNAISPKLNNKDLDVILDELDTLVPGEGDLNQRMNDFNDKFVIPNDKLDLVFKAAINESRKRSKQYIPLSENENFKIEYVNDKVWSGYNWYKGDSYSLIQLNTDFPMYISRAIDLACHEAYPGHHVFNSLIENHLVKEKGWMEYCVYVLYSPLSLLAEGSANYGIELTFNKKDRMQFEKEVLFPIAGLDAKQADLYYEIQEKMQKLSYAGNMVSQQYLDGIIDKSTAIDLLMKYSLSSKARSTQRLAFIEAHRSYVINYNLGEDIVRDYVENLAKNKSHETKWKIFSDLLSNPRTASMMQ